jgi:hypothetical protein
MFPSIDSTRRRFLSQAAGMAAGDTVFALATIPPMAAVGEPAAALPNDSGLLKLEEQIFEQYEGATANDDEVYRVFEIWSDEVKRLQMEAIAGRCALTAKDQWELVKAMPESKEHTRLVGLQQPFYARMDALIKQMFAIPAHTADGRRAKATVLLTCIMGSEWTQTDKETEYDIEMARTLLIEFIGGDPGKMLRDQFA